MKSKPIPPERSGRRAIPGASARFRLGRRSGRACAMLALALSISTGAGIAQAQSEPFLGQLMLVPYTFCPRGWTEAGGQIIGIAQNTALYALLGTTYGGDGRTTFGLPDLRGRVPVGQGQGPGLSNVDLGQLWGQASVTLTTSQMPAHTHALQARSDAATHAAPANDRVLATTQNAGSYVSGSANTPLDPTSVGTAGSGLPFPVQNPSLGMRWCIALEGVYPSRN